MTAEEKINEVMELVEAYVDDRSEYSEDVESAQLTVSEAIEARKCLAQDREFIEAKLRQLIKDDE